MANISLTGDTLYSQKINNFSGELFRVGGQRTPFLSATGGLNGGKVLQLPSGKSKLLTHTQ